MIIPDISTILHVNQSLDEPKRKNVDSNKLLENFERYTGQARTVVKSLKNSGIAEIKAMNAPPEDVKKVMECIMVILRKPASD